MKEAVRARLADTCLGAEVDAESVAVEAEAEEEEEEAEPLSLTSLITTSSPANFIASASKPISSYT